MDYCGECDIAYEGRDCPLCEALKKVEALEQEIERLNNLE